MTNIPWDPMKEESPYSKWCVSVVRDGEVVWESDMVDTDKLVQLPDFFVPRRTVRFTGKRLDVDNHE